MARRGRRSRRRHLEVQFDIQARKLYLEFSNWISTHMRDIWTLKPGFYTEFRAGSIWQSGLARGAILEKMLVWALSQNQMFICWTQNSKHGFVPKRARQPLASQPNI